jgi:hypothetical protein
MKPHKWAKEIHAWADGAAIEGKDIYTGEWVEIEPYWETDDEYEYRIKSQPSEPQPKEPQYLYVYSGYGHDTISLVYSESMAFYKDGRELHLKYIGKIKLETEDD